jgi:hypothetical protein
MQGKEQKVFEVSIELGVFITKHLPESRDCTDCVFRGRVSFEELAKPQTSVEICRTTGLAESRRKLRATIPSPLLFWIQLISIKHENHPPCRSRNVYSAV